MSVVLTWAQFSMTTYIIHNIATQICIHPVVMGTLGKQIGGIYTSTCVFPVFTFSTQTKLITPTIFHNVQPFH